MISNPKCPICEALQRKIDQLVAENERLLRLLNPKKKDHGE